MALEGATARLVRGDGDEFTAQRHHLGGEALHLAHAGVEGVTGGGRETGGGQLVGAGLRREAGPDRGTP